MNKDSNHPVLDVLAKAFCVFLFLLVLIVSFFFLYWFTAFVSSVAAANVIIPIAVIITIVLCWRIVKRSGIF